MRPPRADALISAERCTEELRARRCPEKVRKSAGICSLTSTDPDEHPSGITASDVRILHGSRSADGTQSVRTQRVAAALADIADEQNRRILAQLQDGLGPGGIAVEGVEDTFGALAEGRVGLLVLTDALGEATVWYGPRPTSVFATAEAARLSHQPVATGDLADVAVRAALVAEGRVRLVPAADPHAPRDGIGALCRYPD